MAWFYFVKSLMILLLVLVAQMLLRDEACQNFDREILCSSCSVSHG